MQVDFYLVHDARPDSRLKLACRLVETAFKHQQSVLIWTQTAQMAEELDELLWRFKQTSFIPHARLEASMSEQMKNLTPIWIGHGQQTPPSAAVLVPLSKKIPPFYRQFERLLDPVNGDDTEREAARQRFREYRQQGIEPRHHILAAE